MSDWTYNGKPFLESDIDEAFGFVYRITNTQTSKIYIGKKFFTKAKTTVKMGKKRRSRVDSDWKEYYSSSEILKSDVELLGKAVFKREILRLCKNRAECTYWEAHYQFAEGVLLLDTYNSWISCKVRRGHLK